MQRWTTAPAEGRALMESTTDPAWEASMEQYRQQVDANPSLRRDPILAGHLERIRLTHQKLLAAKARVEPPLVSLPAEVLADIPIWSATADRFADFASEAQAMADHWEALAKEYDGLDRRIRAFLAEDESRARRLRDLNSEEWQTSHRQELTPNRTGSGAS